MPLDNIKFPNWEYEVHFITFPSLNNMISQANSVIKNVCRKIKGLNSLNYFLK